MSGSRGRYLESESALPFAETPPLACDRSEVLPDQKYSMDNTPHTPTPFKNALEKYGPLKPLPQTPHLEEDLKES